MTRPKKWPCTGFGARLSEIREERDLTRRAFAELIGFDENTVWKMETGRQEPAWPVVVAVCLRLGIEPNAFFSSEAITSGAFLGQLDRERRGEKRQKRKKKASEAG